MGDQIEVTVRCGCSRIMRTDGAAGPAHYRCGCGARVALTGLPTRSATRCQMPRGNRVCNGPKLADRPLCEPCMIKVADEALLTPDLAGQLGDQRGVAEFNTRQLERREQLLADWRDANASRVDRTPVGPRCGVVYYCELRPGIVKIGTTLNLPARMSSLHIPRGAVLAAEPGTYDVEKLRHQQFSHVRIGKPEDFIVDDSLRAHIDKLAAEHGDPFELATRLWLEQEELAQDPDSELSSAKVG